MNKFRVLARNQDFMARWAISSHNLDDPTNEFFKSITAYYVLFFILAVDIGGHWVTVYIHWPDLSAVLQPFSISMAAVEIGGAYFCIGLSMKKIKTLHNELQLLVNEDHEQEISDIYWGVEQKCRKYTRVVICYFIFNLPAFIGPLPYSFYCISRGNYDTSAWTMPLDITLPFDTTTLRGWYLNWFIQVNTDLAYALSFILITSYFVCCCLYIGAICDHFDFLCDSIVDSIDRNRMEEDLKKYQQRHQQIKVNMGRMIKVHMKMTDIFQLMVDIHSGSLFWLLPPNVLFLAVSLYSMENTSFQVAEFFFQMLCIFSSLLWPFIHCYYADMTTDRMKIIGEKIFEPKLVELPVELQKPIILIIGRSQQELRFNGGGMVYCTLESFGKLCNSSVSYYMIFRGLTQH